MCYIYLHHPSKVATNKSIKPWGSMLPVTRTCSLSLQILAIRCEQRGGARTHDICPWSLGTGWSGGREWEGNWVDCPAYLLFISHVWWLLITFVCWYNLLVFWVAELCLVILAFLNVSEKSPSVLSQKQERQIAPGSWSLPVCHKISLVLTACTT